MCPFHYITIFSGHQIWEDGTTSTIALQEQLWCDVRTVMSLLGLKRDVILAKGQTHYLCNKRADEYMRNPNADAMTVMNIRVIRAVLLLLLNTL